MQLNKRRVWLAVLATLVAVLGLSACGKDGDAAKQSLIAAVNNTCNTQAEKDALNDQLSKAQDEVETAENAVDKAAEEAGPQASRSDQEKVLVKEAEAAFKGKQEAVKVLNTALGKCTVKSTPTSAAKATSTTAPAPPTSVPVAPTCPPAPVAATGEVKLSAAAFDRIFKYAYKGFTMAQLVHGIDKVVYDPKAFTAGAYSFNNNGYIPLSRAEFVKSFNEAGTRAALQKAALTTMVSDWHKDRLTKAGCTGLVLEERLKQHMDIELARMQDEKSFYPFQITVPGYVEGIDYTDGEEIFMSETPRALLAGDIQYAFVLNDGDYVDNSLQRHACKNRMRGAIVATPPGTKAPDNTKPVEEPPKKLTDKLHQAGVNQTTGTTMPRVFDQDTPGNNNAAEVGNPPLANVDEPNGPNDDNIPVGNNPRTPDAGPVNPTTSTPSPVQCTANQEMNAKKECVPKVNTSTSVVPPAPVPTTSTTKPTGPTSTTGSTTPTTIRETTTPPRPSA